MYMKEATVNNQVGLHARPATFFIQKANEFKSSVWVEKDERRVNAKSLLGVLSLGIVKGTGALRKAVREHLKRSRYVKEFRPGVYGEGEDGVTIAELR